MKYLIITIVAFFFWDQVVAFASAAAGIFMLGSLVTALAWILGISAVFTIINKK